MAEMECMGLLGPAVPAVRADMRPLHHSFFGLMPAWHPADRVPFILAVWRNKAPFSCAIEFFTEKNYLSQLFKK